MKFAARISSIRRSAWNACRSCSSASLSQCAASLASNAAAVHDLDRAADRAEDARDAGGVGRAGRRVVPGDDQLGRGVEAPLEAVLARLGRVRFVERLAEEELQEAAPVGPPGVPVVALP